MTQPSGPGLTYRADIDGLRAVAVLAVVAYHAFPRHVGGGYLGVDVFFVISGFLITRLILDGLERDAFSLTAFFGRRVRRLFPALCLVLLFVLAAGWRLLLPDEYAALGTHAAAGAAFSANFVSWQTAGYFDVHADRKPLLHLWSLGVEEQFYLVWPAVLAVIWRRRANLFVVISVAALVSLALWFALADAHADAAFYLLPSRFWQILAGALLARPSVAARYASASRSFAEGSVALGLTLIAASVMLADGATPGVWALAPVAGAMLCVAFAPRAKIGRRALSWGPLVGIGLISYPLYLWHWPLLSFARITTWGDPLWPVRVALVILAALLAWATYAWVERPIRARRWPRVTAPRLAAALGLVCAGAVAVAATGGVASRLARSPYLQIDRGFSVVLPGTESCDEDSSDLTQCRTSTDAPKVAIVGDSHADALFYGFLNSGDAYYSQVLLMTQAGCQPALQRQRQAGCEPHMRSVVEALRARSSVELVVLTGNSAFADEQPVEAIAAMAEGYARMIETLRAAGKRVVVVADVPHVPFDPADCMRPRTFTRSPEADTLCRAYPIMPRPGYDAFLAQLAARLSDLDLFDPAPVFCDSAGCHAFVDQVPQYKDGAHLSHAGSLRVAHAFIAR